MALCLRNVSGVQEARQLITFHGENSSTVQAQLVCAEADREGAYSIMLLLRSDPLLCASAMLWLDAVHAEARMAAMQIVGRQP